MKTLKQEIAELSENDCALIASLSTAALHTVDSRSPFASERAEQLMRLANLFRARELEMQAQEQADYETAKKAGCPF